MQQCLIGCGMLKNLEKFDHYQDVKDKFPKEVERILIPRIPTLPSLGL
jgi:hypothetical protein